MVRIMVSFRTCVLLLLLLLTLGVAGTGQEKILDALKRSGYDHWTRPSDNVDGPVRVNVSIRVEHLRLGLNQMEAVLSMVQSWRDARLRNVPEPASITATTEDLSPYIWTPDLFFANSMTKSEVIGGDLLRLTTNGDVFWSKRVKERLLCVGAPFLASMLASANVESWCSLDLESYGHNARDLLLITDQASFNVQHKAADRSMFRLVESEAVVGRNGVSFRLKFDPVLSRPAANALLHAAESLWYQ